MVFITTIVTRLKHLWKIHVLIALSCRIRRAKTECPELPSCSIFHNNKFLTFIRRFSIFLFSVYPVVLSATSLPFTYLPRMSRITSRAQGKTVWPISPTRPIGYTKTPVLLNENFSPSISLIFMFPVFPPLWIRQSVFPLHPETCTPSFCVADFFSFCYLLFEKY